MFPRSAQRAALRSSTPWFVLFVSAVCVWVLSLPLFVSQDGPMHRYYAHSLAGVLARNPHYDAYVIRHPFPPYATHYALLIGLSHVCSWAWAEKIVACLAILCFAFGLRTCATAVGSRGAWTSLLIAPLLLPWYLFMGFFNYSLAIGLALFAIGLYLRLESHRGSALAAYCAVVLLLTLSHPVPMLLVLIFVAGDTLWRLMTRPGGLARRLRGQRRQLGALFFLVLACAYASQAVDKSKAASTLGGFSFHPQFARSMVVLSGLSPYNSRSHLLAVNGYRLCVYVLLVISGFLAVRLARRSLQARRLTPAGEFLVYAALLAWALPFLPDVVNGSRFFALRLVSPLWVFLLLAASGGAEDTPRLRRTCISLGAVFTILTLLPAEKVLRPISRSLAVTEQQSVPANAEALLLDGPLLPVDLRTHYEVVFDPFLWANVLPLVLKDDIVMNAPWIDQTISPLRPAPGSRIELNANPLMEIPAADPPPRFTRVLPDSNARRMLRTSSIVMYAGTSDEIDTGVGAYLGEEAAAEFACSRITSWSLTCLRKTAQPPRK